MRIPLMTGGEIGKERTERALDPFELIKREESKTC